MKQKGKKEREAKDTQNSHQIELNLSLYGNHLQIFMH
jgi:hypothetical protein